jgi:membrane protease YdiL (CAAX protease family)
METANTGNVAQALSLRLTQRIRQYPLWSYFLIAFGVTWTFEALVYGVLHIPFDWAWTTLLLTLAGPTLAAFVVTGATQGRAGVRLLLRGYVRWRVGAGWYLLILLGAPALFLLPYLSQPDAFSAIRMPGADFWLIYLIVFGSTLVAGGPLGEEPGWRGFALPRLEQRPGPLLGSLILGVLWGLWHLPLFLLVPGYNGAGSGFLGILIPFVAFVIMVTAYTIAFTWVFNNTRGSILLAILLHTSINTAPAMLSLLFPSLARTPLFGVSTLLVWVVAAAIIIAATRGRLSYQRYLQETALTATPQTPESMDHALRQLVHT